MPRSPGPRSPDLTPSSSVPGTPSLGHPDLPGLRVSGRVSRISSAGSDRASFGATLVQSATENVVDRCVYVQEACEVEFQTYVAAP